MANPKATLLHFYNFCNLCEKISLKNQKQDKIKELEAYIGYWRKYHAKLKQNDASIDGSFFPAMRLLLPQCEKDRGAYGIRENTIAKIYIDILTLEPTGDAAQKLLHYQAPKTAKSEAGDFASVAELVLKNRLPDRDTFYTIAEINKYLDTIARCNAERKRDELKKNMTTLLNNTTPLEQKWLIRIILKQMKVGISDQSVLNAFHPDAKDLYDVNSSMAKVCDQLNNPNIRLHEIEVTLFTPFRPMLAARAQPNKAEKIMNNEPFNIDTKLDGERVQLHKEGNCYKFYSRSGLEYTHMYGGSPLDGSFTHFIAPQFEKGVVSCILDGEMCGWNKILNCIGRKGQNFDVKTLHPDDEEYQPCFFAFDILLYNGQVLSNKPLSSRLKCLENIFNPLEGRIMFTPSKQALSNQDVIDALNEAIDNREEGIVLKNPSSIYKPNSRGWIKVKPEYIDNLMNEMDLIILGGYFGEGRRSGLLSHFLLGVAVKSDSGDPKQFHSFTKVGSGYSLQELHHLLNKLKGEWKVYDKKKPPANIILASGHKERPDLWIEPCKSQIVQVKAAEITRSERFKTGCTLRFPRVERVRYDKPWNQCLNLDELEALRTEAEGKLASRHMEDDTGVSPKKKARVEVVKSLPEQFRPADVSDVKQVSSSFEGKEICVLSGFEEQTKADLEKVVVKLGGTFVQNPGEDTFCIVTAKLSQKAKNLIKNSKYDVVTSKWLSTCDKQQSFIPWTPFDMWYTKPETVTKLALEYDKYGDSYYENTDIDTLKLVFDRIKQLDIDSIRMTSSKIADLEFEYFPNTSKLGLFRINSIYMDNKAIIGDTDTKISNHCSRIAELELRYFGATVTDRIDDKTTHVLTHTGDTERLDGLKEMHKSRDIKFNLVNEQWVFDCIATGKLENERQYYP